MFRVILGVWLMAITCFSSAAPKADLWSFWQPSDEGSLQQLDHGAWQQILDRYLRNLPDQSNRLFAYAEVTQQDRKLLDQYLLTLASFDPRTLSREQQFAYWVNLYNALTVQLILTNYPLESIRSLGEGWLSFGPWDDSLYKLQGQSLSLNDIEHRILRPLWQDPRIHYVVNCASFGCPDLSDEAFTGANNERLLESAAQRFINQDKGVKLTSKTILLSSIYDWYGSDFGDRTQLFRHLGSYATDDRADLINGYLGPLEYAYNWTLNDVQNATIGK